MAGRGRHRLPLTDRRWKGYGGDYRLPGRGRFETITWATGLLAQTKRITVFGTVHAPLLPAEDAIRIDSTAMQARTS